MNRKVTMPETTGHHIRNHRLLCLEPMVPC